MLKQRFVVPLFLLFALTGEVAYSQATICKKTGFFDHFLQEWMKLSGTCSNNYSFAYVGLGPGGLFLAFLNNNQNIPLELKNDITATADNVNLQGRPNSTVTVKVKKGSKAKVTISGGGEDCNLTGRVIRNCKYTVLTTDCTKIKRTEKICGPCEDPCPDYGDESIEIFVTGTKPGTERCSARLRRANRKCIKCSGKMFSPVDQ